MGKAGVCTSRSSDLHRCRIATANHSRRREALELPSAVRRRASSRFIDAEYPTKPPGRWQPSQYGETNSKEEEEGEETREDGENQSVKIAAAESSRGEISAKWS